MGKANYLQHNCRSLLCSRTVADPAPTRCAHGNLLFGYSTRRIIPDCCEACRNCPGVGSDHVCGVTRAHGCTGCHSTFVPGYGWTEPVDALPVGLLNSALYPHTGHLTEKGEYVWFPEPRVDDR